MENKTPVILVTPFNYGNEFNVALNDKPIPTIRANINMVGIIVPPGSNFIKFSVTNFYFNICLSLQAIVFISLIVLAGILFLDISREKRLIS